VVLSLRSGMGGLLKQVQAGRKWALAGIAVGSRRIG
jgi:hypothetical protein